MMVKIGDSSKLGKSLFIFFILRLITPEATFISDIDFELHPLHALKTIVLKIFTTKMMFAKKTTKPPNPS